MVVGTDDRSLTAGSLEERKAAFRLWVATVRDPAQANTEGTRKLSVIHGAATADYEIAPLPNGRWAVTVDCCYHCGNFCGIGTPWTEFASREECVESFLETARNHFGQKQDLHALSLQKQAQLKMKRLLSSGLFGFIEPTPS